VQQGQYPTKLQDLAVLKKILLKLIILGLGTFPIRMTVPYFPFNILINLGLYPTQSQNSVSGFLT
ncbi:hypothetical protein, partial [Vibrio penaeicida]|uniref:hypothetical protein n=1 Tax=Vibrio penaeicida TaxID=104609 RepID=UPI001C8C98DF